MFFCTKSPAKSFTSSAKLQKGAANAPSARVFPIRPKQSKKPPSLPFSDHGFHSPAISRRQVILLRPHAPIYKSDYQCINNKQFSLQHITKSQITISLIANHQPFYHRPLIGTPIRQGVYRGAQYWDKPHRRYR